MANLIILEGVSRTGKSTITDLLSKEYGFRNISIKEKMPESISKDKLPSFYHGMHIIANEFYKAFPDQTFILDRSFLSEIVYSTFFNRESFINCDSVISNILLENKFVLVNLTGTYQTYLERTPKDKFVYTELEYIKQKDLFSWHFEKTKSNETCKEWPDKFVEIDTSVKSIYESVELIKNALNKNSII